MIPDVLTGATLTLRKPRASGDDPDRQHDDGRAVK